MSVIVKRLKSTSMEIYVKGAPEVMPDICDPASCELNYTYSENEAYAEQSQTITKTCCLITREMDSV
jgi:magnesium-transporting ATPase (P-type)